MWSYLLIGGWSAGAAMVGKHGRGMLQQIQEKIARTVTHYQHFIHHFHKKKNYLDYEDFKSFRSEFEYKWNLILLFYSIFNIKLIYKLFIAGFFLKV